MMVRVEFASACDWQAIESLWQSVFGDEIREIRSFLEKLSEKDTVLVVRNREEIVSMLFLIETTLCFGTARQRVGYIYAGATHPKERGKGLYKCLLDAAEKEAVKRGMSAVFLQPADEALAKTYKRQGFSVPLYTHQRKGDLYHCSLFLKSLSPHEYQNERRRVLSNIGATFIEWPLWVYEHTALWGKAVMDEDRSLTLITNENESFILERLDGTFDQAMKICGLLKPLSEDGCDESSRIYMGYAMD